ncbi:transposase [bacterium]|nr:transposase [bacterium]
MLSFTSKEPIARMEDFVERSFLFITAGTYQKRPFIAGDDRKSMLVESLDFNCYKWGWKLTAYAILDNHYHLIVRTPGGDVTRLAHIIQSAHSFSAYHWRRDDPTIRTRIWWNFWEAVLKTPEALIEHINYVHLNPKLHGTTSEPASYAFSSMPAYLALPNSPLEDWMKKYVRTPADLIDAF